MTTQTDRPPGTPLAPHGDLTSILDSWEGDEPAPPDLLAELQEKIDKARAQLAAAKRQETTARKQRATGLTEGQRVRTNCPRSPRFHERDGVVIGKANLGEIGVSLSKSGTSLSAYFLPSELIKL